GRRRPRPRASLGRSPSLRRGSSFRTAEQSRCSRPSRGAARRAPGHPRRAPSRRAPGASRRPSTFPRPSVQRGRRRTPSLALLARLRPLVVERPQIAFERRVFFADPPRLHVIPALRDLAHFLLKLTQLKLHGLDAGLQRPHPLDASNCRCPVASSPCGGG